MSGRRVMHASIDVLSVLLRAQRRRAALDICGLVDATTGRRLSRDEAERELERLVREGTLYLPLGSACEGWDPRTGCPGHPVEPDA